MVQAVLDKREHLGYRAFKVFKVLRELPDHVVLKVSRVTKVLEDPQDLRDLKVLLEYPVLLGLQDLLVLMGTLEPLVNKVLKDHLDQADR